MMMANYIRKERRWARK